MAEIIKSGQNPKIKQIIKLRKTAKRRQEDLILIEGYKEIIMAINSGIMVESLFYCEDLANNKINIDSIMSQALIRVSGEVFKKIAYREHPDGFLALARPRCLGPEKIKLSSCPLVIVLETIEKPGNLGAILRSADAAGVDAVLVCDPKTDLYNPNVIRASLGAVFTNQVAVCASREAIAWLKQNNVRIYAAAPEAQKLYFNLDYTEASAIAIGAEHEGLSRVWLEQADEKIKIPMQGKIDSLNASASTAIILFEALRQRKK